MQGGFCVWILVSLFHCFGRRRIFFSFFFVVMSGYFCFVALVGFICRFHCCCHGTTCCKYYCCFCWCCCCVCYIFRFCCSCYSGIYCRKCCMLLIIQLLQLLLLYMGVCLCVCVVGRNGSFHLFSARNTTYDVTCPFVLPHHK